MNRLAEIYRVNTFVLNLNLKLNCKFQMIMICLEGIGAWKIAKKTY